MDNWFEVHGFIASYLSAFHYAVSTEGDHHLRDQYQHYIISESCKLAQASRLREEKMPSRLNRQAVAIQELGRFKHLSEERRREREEKERNRMRFLYSRAHRSYGDPYYHRPREERQTKRRH